MLNRVDAAEYGQQTRMSTPVSQTEMGTCGVGREMTVGELIGQRILKAERLLKQLHDLKGSLSQDFLNSGASRISALLDQ
jgi:hypothetical protein